MTGAWTALRIGDRVVLRRTVECVVCCKRKRDTCGICNGTGLRVVDVALTVEEARALSVALDEAAA